MSVPPRPADRRPPGELAGRLRGLPSVDRVVAALDDDPRAAACAREVLDELRAALRAGTPPPCAPDLPGVSAETARRVARAASAAYPLVVNATGVLLHTGLGRAPLSAAAAEAVAAIARGYCRLEVEPETGARRHREAALADDLGALTGAAASTVVNNNAAALLLILRALAAERDVVVSRGELIEIGGGFRLPELMALSGARLVEVGTTNRTYVEDFAAAIGSDTALLLTVHTSNYRVVGFQHAPDRAELVALAREAGVPLVEDAGSGLLAPGPGVLAEEPAVAEAIAAGVDLVCFSGDKLLGGPQAGVIVGRADLVARCRGDALFRALRPDRLTLAALAATLAGHRRDPAEVPVAAVLAAAPRARLEQARALSARLASRFPGAAFEATLSDGRVGSGSSPERELGSAAVDVAWPGLAAEELARRLRAGDPPVWARTWRERLRLDVLALRPGDEDRLIAALAAVDADATPRSDAAHPDAAHPDVARPAPPPRRGERP